MITARVVGMINGDLLVTYEDSDEKDWSGGVATGIGRGLDKARKSSWVRPRRISGGHGQLRYAKISRE